MAKLYFHYGAMDCDTTTLLQQVATNYEERGTKVAIITAASDTLGNDQVVSRVSFEGTIDILLKPNDKVFKKIPFDGLSAIIVDEAQFLTAEQVDDFYFLTKEFGIPVLCYGLHCDFRMNAFPGYDRLLQIADTIEEMKTNESLDEINYKAVCGECSLLNRKKKMNFGRNFKSDKYDI